jgi:hypothetical protein
MYARRSALASATVVCSLPDTVVTQSDSDEQAPALGEQGTDAS